MLACAYSSIHRSIRLDYKLEKPQDFGRALAALYLNLKKAEQRVEMLIICW